MQKSEGPQHGLGSNRISIVMEDCFHLCKACSRHSQLVSEGVRERARGGKRVKNLKIYILCLFCWPLCFCICCILISSNKVPLGKHSTLPQMVSTFSGNTCTTAVQTQAQLQISTLQTQIQIQIQIQMEIQIIMHTT